MPLFESLSRCTGKIRLRYTSHYRISQINILQYLANKTLTTFGWKSPTSFAHVSASAYDYIWFACVDLHRLGRPVSAFNICQRIGGRIKTIKSRKLDDSDIRENHPCVHQSKSWKIEWNHRLWTKCRSSCLGFCLWFICANFQYFESRSNPSWIVGQWGAIQLGFTLIIVINERGRNS